MHREYIYSVRGKDIHNFALDVLKYIFLLSKTQITLENPRGRNRSSFKKMTKPIKSAFLLDFFEISKDCEKNSCSENFTYTRRHTKWSLYQIKNILYQIKNIFKKLMTVIIKIFFYSIINYSIINQDLIAA